MTWLPLGPSCVVFEDDRRRMPLTGACTAIAFDPKAAGTVYVGAANGGVWKTSDGGLTWKPLTDNQVTLSVGAIAVAKTSGDLFVGTGDPFPKSGRLNLGPPAVAGRGVLRSEDGGASWKHFEGELTHGSPSFKYFYNRPHPPTPLDVHDQLVGARSSAIVIYPDPASGDETRLVLGSTRGLYESLDRGKEWTRLVFPNELHHEVTSVVLDDSDAANPILYAAFRKSTEALIVRRQGTGALQKVPQPFPTTGLSRIALALSPPAAGGARILYAAVAGDNGKLRGVASSTTRGDSWDDITGNLAAVMNEDEGNKNLDRRLLVAANPDEPETVYVGGVHLYRRRHGQASWERIGKTAEDRLPLGQHALAFDPHASPPEMWLANTGGVFVSRDGGDTWGHRNRGLVTMQVYSVSTYPRGAIALSGTQDNAAQRLIGHPVWLRSNGGWAESRGDTFSAFDTAIDPKRPQNWYVGLKPSILSQSRRAGLHFRDISPSSPYLSFYRRFVIDPYFPELDEARIFLVDGPPTITGASAHTLRQRNAPKDGWWDVLATFFRNRVMAPFISAAGFAVRPAGDEKALEILHLGLSEDGYVRFDIENAKLVSVFNAGTPSNPPISAVAADRDDNVVYVGEGGIRPKQEAEPWPRKTIARSDTGGAAAGGNPAFTGLNLPSPTTERTSLDNPVHAIVLDPAKPERVLVGTDAGLFRSEDKGASWKPWMQGLPAAMVTGIAIQPTAAAGHPRLVRVSTYGRGVWERDIEADDDVTPPKPDIYLRHHTGFTRRPEPERPSEMPEHEKHFWRKHADLRFDVKRKTRGWRKARSTLDYKPDGPLDHIGFELMRRDRELHAGTDARIYLQVHNRGPVVATDVEARMFWAALAGDTAPALPDDFWSDGVRFNIGMPMDTSVWKQIGGPVMIPEIRPAEPRVCRWEWTVPKSAPSRIAMLAIITSPDDPIDRPVDHTFDPSGLARTNKHVMLATARVRRVSESSFWTVTHILEGLAIAAAVGLVAYETLGKKTPSKKNPA